MFWIPIRITEENIPKTHDLWRNYNYYNNILIPTQGLRCLLYVRFKIGVAFVQRCFRDENKSLGLYMRGVLQKYAENNRHRLTKRA